MSNTTNIMFEMASQFKFRYPYKGTITTEDLWDLTPAQLDTVYKSLNKELQVTEEDSLLRTSSADDGVKANNLRNKIGIVKYIFNNKRQAAELVRMATERSAKKQRILDILARKQENALENMSEDELKKILDDLG